MGYIEHSAEIVGYPVKIVSREAFKVTGYTLIVPPAPNETIVRQFWSDLTADGRLARLQAASSVPTWVLGLGSWDRECAKGGFRYTICIEETEFTDFSVLAREQRLFTTEIGASDWMCFEMTEAKYDARFWTDDPYKMMKALGYRFNGRVGVHFDAYPPGNDPESLPTMEFRITVTQRRVP